MTMMAPRNQQEDVTGRGTGGGNEEEFEESTNSPDVTSSYICTREVYDVHVHLFRHGCNSRIDFDDTGPHAVPFSSHEKHTGTLVDPFAEENDVRSRGASPGLRSPHSTELNHFPRLSMQF